VVPSNDLRSYRIDSEKIKSKIGFSPKRNVKESIREMVDAWRLGRYQGSLESPAYINIKRMQELNLG
jgi:dTDP-D-glucose 4,6-dehydratase